MKRPVCKLQTVGEEAFWFCMACLEEGTHPGDPSWMELSETGVSDSFFTPHLDRAVDHLRMAHGYSKREIRVGDDEIVLK
ncbi:MAG: hypothetical protein ACE5LH_01570 [Fidelibacterota bacterium]